MNVKADSVQKHPLDECDPSECYQTMMSERTELIKARREAEDNLVKTIIQLASALLVLLAGFSVESKVHLGGLSFMFFVAASLLLVISVTAGLAEHYFSSKAYLSQQQLVEQYYTKVISEFSEPPENRKVRLAQLVAFGSFLVSLTLITAIAIAKVGIPHDEASAAASTATAAASTAASTATAASTTAAAASAHGATERSGQPASDQIGRTVDATTTTH